MKNSIIEDVQHSQRGLTGDFIEKFKRNIFEATNKCNLLLTVNIYIKFTIMLFGLIALDVAAFCQAADSANIWSLRKHNYFVTKGNDTIYATANEIAPFFNQGFWNRKITINQKHYRQLEVRFIDTNGIIFKAPAHGKARDPGNFMQAKFGYYATIQVFEFKTGGSGGYFQYGNGAGAMSTGYVRGTPSSEMGVWIQKNDGKMKKYNYRNLIKMVKYDPEIYQLLLKLREEGHQLMKRSNGTNIPNYFILSKYNVRHIKN